ncbi:zinc finger protein 91 isoform X3 [Contarinia nasturtii]|nr:zinc finger protein 91 isoform X3 [Contarinia nasturtii]
MMIECVKEYHSKLDVSQYKGKGKVDFYVCCICFEIFPKVEKLRLHFIKLHGYKLAGTAELEMSSEKIDSNANIHVDDGSEITNIQVITETKPDKVNIITKDNEENDTNNESNWQRPISLKGFKKKLNEIFLVKCSLTGCAYYFENDERRQMHEKCHVSIDVDQVRQFKCLECASESKLWRDCTSHMWKEHKIDIDLLKCPFCSFKSVFAVKVYRHLQIHDQLKGFLCSLCPKSFEQFNQLRQHVATAHIDKNGSSRWYSKKTCDICSNVFATSKTLSKHIKAVHNRIKPFICSVCGYKSARKSTWEIHMRQHTGEKPMSCKVCSFCTADPSVLRKHEMRHNDKTKYQCTECDYTSIQSINFKNHMKRHHPELFRKLLCDHCSFVSVNLDALRKHLQDHKLGLIRNEDSNDDLHATTSKLSNLQQNDRKTVEISSDCFLPVESTDSLAQEALTSGGVTIPAQHSDEAQFPHSCY